MILVVLVIRLIRLGAFRGHALTTGSVARRPRACALRSPWDSALAIWARVHHRAQLGPPDDAEGRARAGHQLARPHWLRHPIDLGHPRRQALGTAVALSRWRLIAVALAGRLTSSTALTIEERYLTEQFPDTYPLYRQSTKMLVPFIF